MVWLRKGEIISKICLFVLTESMKRQTDEWRDTA